MKILAFEDCLLTLLHKTGCLIGVFETLIFMLEVKEGNAQP